MKLHIYSQRSWHQRAMIVGDKEALTRLKEALEKALELGHSGCFAEAEDGEGYNVYVSTLGEEDERWKEIALPYADKSMFKTSYVSDSLHVDTLIPDEDAVRIRRELQEDINELLNRR